MKTPVLALLVATLAVTACSRIQNSRLNPLNWFGRSEAAPVQVVEELGDPRPMVAQVLSLDVDRVPEGAIVRAKGLPPTQGWWDAELVERGLEDGVLTLEFRLEQPVRRQPEGTPPSREVVVASFLSNIKLESIRRIVVQGASNARAVGR